MNCTYFTETPDSPAAHTETSSRALVRLIDFILPRGRRGERSFSEAFLEFVDCYQALSMASDVPLWRPVDDGAASAAMADALSEAMESGELTPAPLRLAARFVFSTLEGLQWQVRDGNLPRKEAAEIMSMMVLEGLAAPAEPRSEP